MHGEGGGGEGEGGGGGEGEGGGGRGIYLWTVSNLFAAGVDPSRRRYVREDMCILWGDVSMECSTRWCTHLKRSVSIMSNMLLYWQNTRALCWLTAAAVMADSAVSSPPIPQSSNSCLIVTNQ